MRKILQSPEDIYEAKLIKEETLEISRQMSETRLKKLYALTHEARKKDYFSNINFYIVLVPSQKYTAVQIPGQKLPEMIMEPEDKVFFRRSCPTPAYNQNVWKYHKETDQLEFLWSIPRKNISDDLYRNRNRYLSNPALKSRTSFVVMMESGELEKWVAKENKEDPNKPKAIIKVNKPAVA
jgi:hypothetical protein